MSDPRNALWFAGLMVVTGFLVGGCASGGAAASEPEALVQRRCSVCHTLDRVNQAKKDEAGWNATVDRMRAKGAVVSQAEHERIVEYLVGR